MRALLALALALASHAYGALGDGVGAVSRSFRLYQVDQSIHQNPATALEPRIPSRTRF